MKRYEQEQMAGLYEQWQLSGQSKADFAKLHGICRSTFYYWARKFEQLATVGFQPLAIEESMYKTPGELMAAIQYPTGVRLELYSSFQKVSNSYAELLKTLVG